MQGEMKNKVMLLGVLFVAGLLLAGATSALGGGNLLQFGKQVSGTVTGNADGTQTVIIKEDGQVVKEVTLPEKEGYATAIKGTPDGQMVITQVPEQEIQENCNKPGFHCETSEFGQPAQGISCVINGQEVDPANCPKPE